MNKIKYLLVLALVLFLPFVVNVKADEENTKSNDKINVYVFRGEGCPHCEEALEFFDSLSKDEEYKDLYKLVKYEVWYDEDNSKLMSKVAEALNTEANGVPFIVVGDKYFSGYSEAMSSEIKDAIKEQYEKKDYKDIVKTVKAGEKVDAKKKESAFVPIIIVSVVALISVIGLIFFTKEK